MKSLWTMTLAVAVALVVCGSTSKGDGVRHGPRYSKGAWTKVSWDTVTMDTVADLDGVDVDDSQADITSLKVK